MNKKDKLLEKLEGELQAYKEDLMKGTKEEIIYRSYESAIKEEMKDMFEFRELEDEKLDSLLQGDNILETCYNEWLHEDSNLQELFEITLERTIADYKYIHRKKNVEKDR